MFISVCHLVSFNAVSTICAYSSVCVCMCVTLVCKRPSVLYATLLFSVVGQRTTAHGKDTKRECNYHHHPKLEAWRSLIDCY